ncbi:MGMT family protein [Stenotrophomonas cyclobalanopsidis]|uniref:MGMT family protein n=1 Tax=Stenotrophomonas cyclobalanopsidis TaxID=2771362 RepID=UPI00345F3D71
MTPEQARDRILAVIRAIPPGQVLGYGQVAMRAGLPGRARLTARILGQNEDPHLPWHRVLRSDGRIAMAEGSAGWREQSQRLRAEGVVVENGRVRMPASDPAAVLDAAIWGSG